MPLSCEEMRVSEKVPGSLDLPYSSFEHASKKLLGRPKRSLPNLRKGELDTFLYEKGLQAVPELSKRTLLCIIMFNLALVQHLQSFEDPSRRTISLQNANAALLVRL